MEERRAISATPWPGRQSHPPAVSPCGNDSPADTIDLPGSVSSRDPARWGRRPHRIPRPAHGRRTRTHVDAAFQHLHAASCPPDRTHSPRRVHPGGVRRAPCATCAARAAGPPLGLRAFHSGRPALATLRSRPGASGWLPAAAPTLAGIIHESVDACGLWQLGAAPSNGVTGCGNSTPTRSRGRRPAPPAVAESPQTVGRPLLQIARLRSVTCPGQPDNPTRGTTPPRPPGVRRPHGAHLPCGACPAAAAPHADLQGQPHAADLYQTCCSSGLDPAARGGAAPDSVVSAVPARRIAHRTRTFGPPLLVSGTLHRVNPLRDPSRHAVDGRRSHRRQDPQVDLQECHRWSRLLSTGISTTTPGQGFDGSGGTGGRRPRVPTPPARGSPGGAGQGPRCPGRPGACAPGLDVGTGDVLRGSIPNPLPDAPPAWSSGAADDLRVVPSPNSQMLNRPRCRFGGGTDRLPPSRSSRLATGPHRCPGGTPQLRPRSTRPRRAGQPPSAPDSKPTRASSSAGCLFLDGIARTSHDAAPALPCANLDAPPARAAR